MLHIAIADDHVVLRRGLVLLLNSFESCVVDIEADNGAELIEKIMHTDILPDICILDLSMPVMDGYEALKKIHCEWPDMKVVILSIHYNEYAVVKTMKDGAACCLPKEISSEEFHLALKQVHTKGYYHTEFVKKVIAQDNVAKINITSRELSFLRLCCSDFSYKQIAEHMKVSPRTIDGYRDTLYAKLNVRSRSALVLFAMRSGLTYENYENFAKNLSLNNYR